jgi:16S rRNA (cytidine1402-2'-O)-methyltransferase
MASSGKLTVVPTPIGNLEDMTYRAVRVLKDAELILAEDTRTSRKLLDHYGIETSLKSHHQHNEHHQIESLVDRLHSGARLALISDAGTPGISDPGFLLIRACREVGVEVECLPGATAFVPALVSSGIPCDRFVYEGFLPLKKGRKTRLEAIAAETRTTVLYESPHRLIKLLTALVEIAGPERRVGVFRELTKLHEEHNIGPVAEILQDYSNRPSVKGEIVIVVEGAEPRKRKRKD